ncbi:MAG: twin-arginine translocase subunit TatC [Planctomycetaceae bacterium]|nr:twin-arginine translocase subunit TatC [Planctomycetaceae bacterium]
MPRSRDLFDDSTMTFGEHLEVLRTHVWRALIGLVIGVILALFFGDRIIGFLRKPIDEALRKHNMPAAPDDLGNMDIGGFLKQLFSGEEPEPDQAAAVESPPKELAEDEIEVEIPAADLNAALRKAVPGITITESPATKPNGDSPNSDVVVPIVLKAPEFALLRKTADRFNRPVTYKVEEAFLAYIRISLVAGFVLSSWWIFYQIWLFVAAGLFPHERRYVYIYLPMSVGLFAVGALFCFYFVFPIVLDFLISFNKWLGVELQPRLSEYISLVLMLPVMFGISFQLPLVMLFIERIGIVTIEGYWENWRMAVLIISIVSMLLTPSDPTSMMLMMFPLIILYFAGIYLCKFRPGASFDPLA